jgi:small subunit ribosomal protein S9|nr:ribosomal protein S9 [Eutreptiella sp. CCMP1594]
MVCFTNLGKRKSAKAQVSLLSGSGKILINGRDGVEYFQYNPKMIYTIQSPLRVLGLEESYDILVKAVGGGLSGQSEAIKLGVSRALCEIDPTSRSLLKPEGFLTRDARVKERRKYGLKKARKAPQFSKR